MGSFVSSTWLSIRPRPLSPEKGVGEESHGSQQQMPAEKKTRASVLVYGTGGVHHLRHQCGTALQLARGLRAAQSHEPTCLGGGNFLRMLP